MPRAILPFRNPLVFPGTAPGIDQNHVASKNLRFVAFPAAANFYSIVNSQPWVAGANIGTVSGAPAALIDGKVGPAVTFPSGAAIIFQAAGNSQVGPANAAGGSITMAGIFSKFTSVSYQCLLQISNGTSPNFVVYNSGFLAVFNAPNGTDVVSNITIGTGPYFVAVSIGPKVNFIAVRLDTGAVQTYSAAGTISAYSDGYYHVGNNGGGNYFGGSIAAVMYSGTYLSIPQLTKWAADPWAFWYPRRLDLGLMLKGPSATSQYGWLGSDHGLLARRKLVFDDGPSRPLVPPAFAVTPSTFFTSAPDVLPRKLPLLDLPPAPPILVPLAVQSSWGDDEPAPRKRPVLPDPGPFINPPVSAPAAPPNGWFGRDEPLLVRRPPQSDLAGVPFARPPDPVGWLGAPDDPPRKLTRGTDLAGVPFVPPPAPKGWLSYAEGAPPRKATQPDPGPFQTVPAAFATPPAQALPSPTDDLPRRRPLLDAPAGLPITPPAFAVTPSTFFAPTPGDLPRKWPLLDAPASFPIRLAPTIQSSWGDDEQAPRRRPPQPDQAGVPFIQPPAPVGWLGAPDDAPRKFWWRALDQAGVPFVPPPAPVGWFSVSDNLSRKPLPSGDQAPFVNAPAAAPPPTGWFAAADDPPRKSWRPVDHAGVPFARLPDPLGWLSYAESTPKKPVLWTDQAPFFFLIPIPIPPNGWLGHDDMLPGRKALGLNQAAFVSPPPAAPAAPQYGWFGVADDLPRKAVRFEQIGGVSGSLLFQISLTPDPSLTVRNASRRIVTVANPNVRATTVLNASRRIVQVPY